MKNKNIIIFSAVGLSIVVAAGGFYYKTKNNNNKLLSEIENFSLLDSITTYPMISNIKSTLSASGNISLNEVNSVYSKSTEKIDTIYFKEGDTVEKGDVILTYNVEDTKQDLINSINEAEIGLKNAYLTLNNIMKPLSSSEKLQYEETITNSEKSLESYKNAVKEKENTVVNTQIQIEQQENKVSQAKTNMDNYKILYDQGVESFNTYNTYKITYETEVDSLESLKRTLTQNEDDVRNAQNDIAYAEKDLENAKLKYEIAKNPSSDSSKVSQYQQQENSIELLQLQLAQKKEELNNLIYELVSPYSGSIIKMNAVEGDSVPVGSAAYTIGDYTDLSVNSYVSEFDIKNVEIGQKATMYTDSDTSTTYEGFITNIGNEAEEQTVNNGKINVVPIELSINSSETILKSGFSINIEILLVDKEDILVVPKTSVLKDQTSYFVFTLDDNENLVKTPVEIGVESTASTEIISGLTVNDRIVETANLSMKEGDNISTLIPSTNSGEGMDLESGVIGPPPGGGDSFQVFEIKE